MATLYVDNKPYRFEGEHRNLLDVCLSLGFNVPYFCWHPAMHSVGACRLCAIKEFKDEKDARGRITMACMTSAKDGARISIDDPEAVKFRANVIEWLMVNHPHDCPVCDEGGECHLQDMTVMTGHVYRRYRFTKRTHRNQYLGPFVTHEMNRCIQCYRCVRFYRDTAGGRDLAVLGWHDDVYFGRHEPGALESEFSGNLAEVCPTGVFDDKTLAGHYTRKWDVQTAPSVCVHCGLGCNTIPGERCGMLRRIHSRFNGAVNGYFLCDRGRYGYEFVNGERRIRQTLARDKSGNLKPTPKKDAVEFVGRLIPGGRAIGIGSPRASLETNFALKTLVGADRFYHGMSERESRLVTSIVDVLRRGPSRTPSLGDIRSADAIFIVGEDVPNTAPMTVLSLREALLQKPLGEIPKDLEIPRWHDTAMREVIQQEKSPLFVATPDRTKIDGQAAGIFRGAPDDIARLAFAVAHAIDTKAPGAGALSEETGALAARIAGALKEARRPLVISGTGCGSEAVIQAAANVAWALEKTARPAGLAFMVSECNSIGAALIGGGSLELALAAVKSGAADTVIIAENDICRRLDKASAEALFSAARHVVVIDHLMTATASKAEIVLPAATFAEVSGTLVNSEGRAQRFYEVFAAEQPIQAGWRWATDLAGAAGRARQARWTKLDDVTEAIVQAAPALAEIPTIVPPAGFREVAQKIPRMHERYSGRTAMTAHIDVHEPQPPDDPDSPLAHSMEGYQGRPPSALVARFWAPGWNSVQAVNKFQIEVGGPLHGGDPGRRLIEPSGAKDTPYFANVPAPYAPRQGEFLIVPAYHVFGSEELSVLSRGVTELSPRPYIALNARDLARLGLEKAGQVRLRVKEGIYDLAVRASSALPEGVAAVPSGLPGMPVIGLPAYGAVSGAAGGAGGGQ